MSNYWLLYWFTRLDNVYGLFQAIIAAAVIGGMVIVFFIIFGSVNPITPGEKEAKAKALGYVHHAVITLLIGIAGVTLLPTQKDMALIIGGKFAIDAATSPKAEKMSNALYDAVMAQLKKAAADKAK